MENQSQNQPESQPDPTAKQPSCACAMSPWRWLGLILLVIDAILLVRENKSGSTGNGVKRNENYDQAVQIAQQQNKPLLLAFHASWCPPCRDMKRITYHNPKVIKISQSFIRVMIDYDTQKSLVNRYNIQRIPTYVILRSDGSTLESFTGYYSPTDFLAKLKTAIQ